MKNAAKTPSGIEALRRQIARLEGSGRHGEASEAVASGCRPLDRLLPMGGFRRGSLVEWLAGGDATGAETLAMFAAREASRDGGGTRRREHPSLSGALRDFATTWRHRLH